MKPWQYKDMNAYSWPIYRTQEYDATDATYNIQYICDSAADSLLADDAWRVKRVRYNKTTSAFVDTCWAINTVDAKRSDYNKGTADFIFKATDLAYVAALTYNAG
jgi:hypothetical protein